MSNQEDNLLKLQHPEFIKNDNLGLPEGEIKLEPPSIKKVIINTHNHVDNECFFLNILKKYFCCKNKSTPYSEEEKEKLVVQEEKETILVQEEEEEKLVVQEEEEKEELLVQEEIRIIFDDLIKIVEEHEIVKE